MWGLLKLYHVFGYILVHTVLVVLAQDKAPVIRECGKDGPTTEIHTVLESVPLLIRNYNFANGSYRNFEDCQIQVWADNRPLVLNVTFNVFDLEAESKCRMDYLCINGVNFCGSWEVNKTFHFKIPVRRSFTMRFVTDSSVNGRGFEIRVDAREIDEQTHFPEVSQGYGSAEELLVLTTPSKGAYRDRCLPESDHLRPGPEFIPNKSDTMSTDGPDSPPRDYQSEQGSDKTTTYQLLTDYHKFDSSQKPVERESQVHDLNSNPLQTDIYFHNSTTDSFQTDASNYDTTPNPLKTNDSNYDSNPNPLQSDDSNYDTTPNPLQSDDSHYDTTPNPLQMDDSNYDTTPNPLQMDDSNYDINPNRLQTDDSNYDTNPNPLQTDDSNYDSNPNPLQTDDFNYDTNSNLLLSDDFSDKVTVKPLQKENYDTTSYPFQEYNTGDNTTSNPFEIHKFALNQLQTNSSSYDTKAGALLTDTPISGTTPVPLQTNDSNYHTAENPDAINNPQYEATLDQHKPNYLFNEQTHFPEVSLFNDIRHDPLHRLDHPENNTTYNPLQTTQLDNTVTPSQNEIPNPRQETTPHPHQTDSMSNNPADSQSGDDPQMSYDTTGDGLDAAVYSKTHTPVIFCSPYIQPVHIKSSNATYLVRNAGFGTRPYFNDERCSVEFHISSPARLLTVKFLYLDLERNSWCSYDSLCVGGDKFCDSSETGHAYSYVVPAGQTFTLAFTTDVSNTGNGFEVEVDIQDAIENVWHRNASVYHGPHWDSIRHQLSNIGSYVDRCSFNPVVDIVTSKFDTTLPDDESTHFSSESIEEGHRTTNSEHITGYSVQASESGQGYETTDKGHQQTEKGYQTTDKGYQTTDKGYQTTDKGYQTTDTGYLPTDAGYLPTDKGYLPTDNGYKTKGPIYKTTDTGYLPTDNGYKTKGPIYKTTDTGYLPTDYGYKTKGPIYKTSESLYQTKDPDEQRMDTSAEVMNPDIQTTDDISASKGNYSVPTRNPWVKSSTIYCGDQPSTVNVIQETSKYIVKSGRQDHRTGYTNNERCLVVYGTTNVPKMFAITFKTFDIEYHQNCCYDFLCMKGVKFCGDWATGYSFRYIVPAFSTFTVAFNTDESKSGQGFEMEITITDPPVDTQMLELSSGVGSREVSLKYKPSNISDYTDKCQHPITCLSDHASSSAFPQTIIPDSTTIRQVLSPDPSFLAQHLRVILRMIAAAQERISYAYDLLTSLI